METVNCLRLTVLGVILSCMLFCGEAKLKEGECEVCISVLNRFRDSVDADVLKSTDAIEEQFQDFCKNVKGKDERFCYYLGGLETSATKIVNKMSKPLSWHMPSDKICEKLKAADAQICDLKYDKQIDLSKVNLKKLKVKELKKILSDWGEDGACKGCAEKSDFIRVVEELMPKYDPKAAQARKDEL